ncbi:ABC transporter permease [Hydrogenophaga sp. BPS33]|uniref:ABC transporter permease n=1 Tax=Hydrogenophaga sp. BPS33 TaxID=2651974 RepID=UPI00131F75B8|nr:FtsX-like permease family protein [Hydrogenophaga sp. BPS33]QHE84452.1 FtsX-like permease family protein [Hydrogenophaga sp. BPS33]
MNTSPRPLPIRFWNLGWSSLVRDWRAGELRLLMLAVTLAVAALTAVGFFADRLQGGLQRDARALIGGDAVVRSDNAPPDTFGAKARELGLSVVQTLTFPTMGRARDEDGGSARLVALKSVGEGYPLRGALRVADALDAPDAVTREIPAPGTAWVDGALLAALDLKVGQALLLGDSSFTITKLIAAEPDRGGGFMSFAPRVMLNNADLPATGLVQPASRLNYRLAVAGDDGRVGQFTRWAKQAIEQREVRGLRLEALESGQPEMQRTLGRAEQFLNLVALLAALLCAVAVAIAARGFAQRHLDDCAMLRVLGLSQGTMARAYTFEFALTGLIASALGVVIGYAVHHVFVVLLAGLVDASLPAPGVTPVLLGLGMGLTLMMAFGLPPVLQLAQVPPLRVIRRDVGQLKPATLVVLGVGLLGFAVLLMAASRDLLLGGIAVGGFAGAVLLFALASLGAVRLLRASVNENTAPRALVMATRQFTARPAYAVVQISALAVGLLALVLLVLLRTDLISSWRNATPPDVPNRFVINVQPEQSEAFQQALRKAGVERYDWHTMIRGRLVSINGKTVNPDDFEGERAQRLVDREFNLSNMAQVPEHNPIVAGKWTENEADALSVEEGLAEELGLKLGDRMAFDIAGQVSEGRITSLRKVDWGSMRVNFVVVFPVADVPNVPVSYISAFRAPEAANGQTGSNGFDNALVREFPNITNVDMTQTIAQVQRVLGQVIGAVEFLFAFTLAAGLVVLLTAITATRGEREREFAILRAVGAGSGLLQQVQRIELLGVGLLAGFLASVVAVIVGWALARYVFQFAWTASPWVPLAGAIAGAVLALMAGWWGLRSVLRTPVVETLRKAAV